MANRHNLKIAKLTQKAHSYTNCVYLNPQDCASLGIQAEDKILIDEQQVMKAQIDPEMKPGTIGCGTLLCQALHLKADQAIGINVLVEAWNNRATGRAQTVSIVVNTYAKAKTVIQVEKLEQYILRWMSDQVFCRDQRFVMKWQPDNQPKPYWLQLFVTAVYESDEEEQKGNNMSIKRKQKSIKFGVIDQRTTISLAAARNPLLELVFPKSHVKSGVQFNYDAETMGIGGLDSQFSVIFRRAFASRSFPPDIVKQLGIKHVKGMLLYGPPGTGKTLIARSIGAMLTQNKPKVINGPEILNKYVGQSEENIRKLFAEAIEEQEQKGDDSSLHIIIFDEIDAICKARGSSATSGSGVHDTVVNQLLSMIDGVNALNNVLIIGMTNRKDLLDDALLRPGRLEVHIEIGLPDEEGREQIFRIHTKSLRDNGFLDENVSIAELAKRTKNYTGAEIEGVVRSAVSYAMQTAVDVEQIGKIDTRKLRNIRITQEYFDLALEEVLPELGKKKFDEALTFMYARGVIDFNDAIMEIKAFVNNVCKTMLRSQSSSLNRQALLLRGEVGTGKSAMAAYLANEVARWPFIRVISASEYVGAADITICQSIDKVFADAYKSDASIIILDDLERLIGYTIGPRFSNPVLQAMLTCIRRLNTTDVERKVFVIATCTPRVARELELAKEFDFVRDMPTVTSPSEFEKVLSGTGNSALCRPDIASVVKVFPVKEDSIKGVGISDLLTVLELSVDAKNEITPQSLMTAWRSKFAFDDLNLLDGFE